MKYNFYNILNFTFIKKKIYIKKNRMKKIII